MVECRLVHTVFKSRIRIRAYRGDSILKHVRWHTFPCALILKGHLGCEHPQAQINVADASLVPGQK